MKNSFHSPEHLLNKIVKIYKSRQTSQLHMEMLKKNFQANNINNS